jgi:hypothetical protein
LTAIAVQLEGPLPKLQELLFATRTDTAFVLEMKKKGTLRYIFFAKKGMGPMAQRESHM